MNNDIIVHLQGGLGNQLFQYAAALAVRKESNPTANLFFVSTPSPHNHLNHDYIHDLFTKGTLIHDISGQVGMYSQRNAFERWNPKFLPTNHTLYLEGYFQYLPAILDILPPLCDDIYRKLTHLVPYKTAIPSNFGFVHVRRGDYLKKPDYHWVQHNLYYMTGMNMLEKHNKNLKNWLIFSDDVEWCKDQEMFRKPNITILEEPNEYQALYLMAQCKAGAVISNSTFSWWGAFMGAYAAGNHVVYPTKWCGKESVYLFPEDWIGLW